MVLHNKTRLFTVQYILIQSIGNYVLCSVKIEYKVALDLQ